MSEHVCELRYKLALIAFMKSSEFCFILNVKVNTSIATMVDNFNISICSDTPCYRFDELYEALYSAARKALFFNRSVHIGNVVK